MAVNHGWKHQVIKATYKANAEDFANIISTLKVWQQNVEDPLKMKVF